MMCFCRHAHADAREWRGCWTRHLAPIIVLVIGLAAIVYAQPVPSSTYEAAMYNALQHRVTVLENNAAGERLARLEADVTTIKNEVASSKMLLYGVLASVFVSVLTQTILSGLQIKRRV